MLCKTCGQELPDDSMFCQYCGSEILIQSASTETELVTSDVALGNNSTIKNRNPKRWIITVCVLSILFLVAVGIIIYQAIAERSTYSELLELSEQVEDLNNTIDDQSQTISEQKTSISDKIYTIASLNEEIRELELEQSTTNSELDFYESMAVIVSDDGTGLYHSYNCPDCDLSYFWIYNVDAAIDNGYRPCSKCQ